MPVRRNGNDLLERQEAILALLDRAAGGLALREICDRLSPRTSPRQVKRALAVLRTRGRAMSTGRGLAARWKRTPDPVQEE